MELWYTEKHTDNVNFSIKIKEQLFCGQSDFQRIDIFDSYEFGKILTIDGLMMLTEKDEFIYHEMIVHVPMATNPNIERVLVIGGGDGGTVRELTRYSTIKKIDMVEIDEMVVDACREYIPQTSSKLDDERVNLYYEDGIKFIQNKKNEYDLIIVDSTDPIGPGEGLFTIDFYNDCYNALSSDGIMINQNESPYYESYAKEYKRAHKKITATFPVAKVYQFHMPVYPSGHWLFGYSSKGIDPVNNKNIDKWNEFKLSTKYYNTDIHRGAFMIPNYVKDIIKDE